MSRTKIKEANLWRKLSKAKEFFGSNLHLVRIENSTDSGTPDVNGCLTYDSKQHEFWLELKALTIPANPYKASFNHGVTQAQISWLHTRSKAGGTCGVLFQFGSGASAGYLYIPGGNVLILQAPLSFMGLLRAGTLFPNSISPEEILSYAANHT